MSECKSTRQMPNEPTSITVKLPGSPASKPATVGGPIFVPFYYASISSFWIYYEVDPRKLRRLLRGTGLSPAIFDKKGLINFNFQNYTAHNGNGLAQTDELEFNIVAYPSSRRSDVPKISAACFLKGEDQTKIIGHYRLHVACGNRFAIAAGKALFGENKFFANFNYTVPSLNLPNQKTWNYKITDLSNKLIMSVDADFHKVIPEPANPAAIIDYSTLNDRLIGSRRNLFGIVNYYKLNSSEAKKVVMKIGKSNKARASKDIAYLLGVTKEGKINSRALATQVVQTPPVIAEARAYYP